MRNARIAEWVLSLVTSPKRAASTVGDLMEDVASRGVLRFWISVSQTALALLWRDLAGNPIRMLRLGALGLLLYVLLMGLFALAILLLFAAVAVISTAIGGPDPQHLVSWLSPTAPRVLPAWLGHYMGVAEMYSVAALIQFQVGRMLARRSPGREIAPCVALTVLVSAINPMLAIFGGGRFPMDHPILELTVYQVPMLLPLLAGAAVVRRRQSIEI